MLLLITTPCYDKGTHYLRAWSQPLIADAEKRGVDVKNLDKDETTKEKFQSYVGKRPVDVIVINGHGNDIAVAGKDNEEIILSVGDGDNLLKDKDVFIRACSSGVVLGPSIMKNGAKGFIGYEQDFIVPLDKDSIGRPLEDKIAAPILECSNQIITSLIKGHSVSEAQAASMKKYEEKFDELSSSNVATTHILPFLLWNMEFQVCYPSI